MTSILIVVGNVDGVLGSSKEGCGLMEGDWENVGGELGMLDGSGDGISEVLGNALFDGIIDG